MLEVVQGDDCWFDMLVSFLLRTLLPLSPIANHEPPNSFPRLIWYYVARRVPTWHRLKIVDFLKALFKALFKTAYLVNP